MILQSLWTQEFQPYPLSCCRVYSDGLGVWFMSSCCCLVEFGSSCFNHAWIESWFVWFGPWYTTGVTVHGFPVPSSPCLVCVSRCLWVCVIEADSLQLRVITVGYIRSCHAVSFVRSLQCLPCSGRRFRSDFLFLVPRFLSPAAFLDSERRRLVCPLLPCATRLCLRRAPP